MTPKHTLQYSRGVVVNYDIGTKEEMQRAKLKYEKEGYICVWVNVK